LQNTKKRDINEAQDEDKLKKVSQNIKHKVEEKKEDDWITHKKKNTNFKKK